MDTESWLILSARICYLDLSDIDWLWHAYEYNIHELDICELVIKEICFMKFYVTKFVDGNDMTTKYKQSKPKPINV